MNRVTEIRWQQRPLLRHLTDGLSIPKQFSAGHCIRYRLRSRVHPIKIVERLLHEVQRDRSPALGYW